MQKTFPVIYKRTSNGKIQTWQAEVDGGRYRSTAGYLDGVKTTTEWTYTKGKNLGKSNATTDETQAIAQVEAIYKKKLEKEYHTSIEAIDEKRFFEPMLAKKWKDVKHKLTVEHVWMQPKLDGVRCISKSDGLWSRQGKPLLGTPHIHELVADLYFRDNPGLILDGELYNHEFKDDFNKIISLVRKTKPTASDLKDAEQLIQYWIYDHVSDLPFQERQVSLIESWKPNDKLVYVETESVHINSVDERAMRWIEEGYEGAMVRLNDPYKSGRSESLIKWKEFQDAEYIIADILPGNGGHADMAARIEMFTQEGNRFFVAPLGNHEYCKELLRNKARHLGKPGTVVFQNLTPDGIPRFGKLKAIRDYE